MEGMRALASTAKPVEEVYSLATQHRLAVSEVKLIHLITLCLGGKTLCLCQPLIGARIT